VYAKAAPIAVELLDEVLDDQDRVYRPQSDEGVSYADKITAGDRALDLSRPAEELVNRVRALSPHIGARARLKDREVTVWRARVGEDGSFAPLEVQPAGGVRMEYDAWLRGLR
jgi:methionyl-tRNA formyltransferase